MGVQSQRPFKFTKLHHELQHPVLPGTQQGQVETDALSGGAEASKKEHVILGHLATSDLPAHTPTTLKGSPQG